MKNKITTIIALSLLVYSIPIQSQEISNQLDRAKSVVNEINSMPLKKIGFHYDPTKEEAIWSLITKDHMKDNYAEYSMNIYIDTLGTIKKYRHEESVEDFHRYVECYYNEDGNMIYLLAKSAEVYSKHYNMDDIYEMGYIYCKNDTSIYQNIKFITAKQDTINKTCIQCLLPSHIGEIHLSNLKTTRDLLNYCGLEIMTKSDIQNGIIIDFNGDLGNKYVTICSNDVRIRKSGDLNAEVLCKKNVGDIVFVEEKIYEQTINAYGTNPWYKVKFHETATEQIGYIYGAFLEPAERELK